MSEYESIEQIIGQNVARARRASGLSQAEIGDQLTAYLGSPWPRQTVSAAEAGKRSFVARDIMSLALVLGTTPSALYWVPPHADRVVIGLKDVDRGQLQGVSNDLSSSPLVDVAHGIQDVSASISSLNRCLLTAESYISECSQLSRKTAKDLDHIEDQVTVLIRTA